MLTKQKTYWEGIFGAESNRVREARRTALPHGLKSQGLWSQVSFQVVSWPISLLGLYLVTQSPSWWCLCLSAKMDSSRRVSGRLGQDASSPPLSFCPLPNSPSQFSVAAPRSLSGLPDVRQLLQTVIIMPGHGGQFRSTVPSQIHDVRLKAGK